MANQQVPYGIVGKFMIYIKHGTAGETEYVGHPFSLQAFK
jgi:hypothetical protein